jgi:hypothetical protein
MKVVVVGKRVSEAGFRKQTIQSCLKTLNRKEIEDL